MPIWGYGFPIGGVAAFDPAEGGVVPAGGVGFDISCGVRTMLTGLSVEDILPRQEAVAESLFRQIPADPHCLCPYTLGCKDIKRDNALFYRGCITAIDQSQHDIDELRRHFV